MGRVAHAEKVSPILQFTPACVRASMRPFAPAGRRLMKGEDENNDDE
jgi:hypothetical protein